MRNPNLTRVLVLILVLLFSVPPAQATGFKDQSRITLGSLHLGMIAQIWNLLAAAWNTNGCGMDPDGRCLTEEPTNTIDSGCRLDPDGRCLPEQTTLNADNGCGFDPNGRCQS